MDIETFHIFVFIMLLIGILKDIIMGSRALEKWLRTRNGHDPKSPATVEYMKEMLRVNLEQTSLEIRESFDRHFNGLMMENRKTNELLNRFLIWQKTIAKLVHGIDLDI